jgi:hypothetical protein
MLRIEVAMKRRTTMKTFIWCVFCVCFCSCSALVSGEQDEFFVNTDTNSTSDDDKVTDSTLVQTDTNFTESKEVTTNSHETTSDTAYSDQTTETVETTDTSVTSTDDPDNICSSVAYIPIIVQVDGSSIGNKKLYDYYPDTNRLVEHGIMSCDVNPSYTVTGDHYFSTNDELFILYTESNSAGIFQTFNNGETSCTDEYYKNILPSEVTSEKYVRTQVFFNLVGAIENNENVIKMVRSFNFSENPTGPYNRDRRLITYDENFNIKREVLLEGSWFEDGGVFNVASSSEGKSWISLHSNTQTIYELTETGARINPITIPFTVPDTFSFAYWKNGFMLKQRNGNMYRLEMNGEYEFLGNFPEIASPTAAFVQPPCAPLK